MKQPPPLRSVLPRPPLACGVAAAREREGPQEQAAAGTTSLTPHHEGHALVLAALELVLDCGGQRRARSLRTPGGPGSR